MTTAAKGWINLKTDILVEYGKYLTEIHENNLPPNLVGGAFFLNYLVDVGKIGPEVPSSWWKNIASMMAQIENELSALNKA